MLTTAARRSSALALLGTLICLLATAPPALASHRQVAIFEDDIALTANPGATLQELRHLGVDVVRVGLHWSAIAPSPNSRRTPHFNATDPNAYPRSGWRVYDTIVRAAQADGITVMFVPTGFAPLWAQGRNPGRYAAHYSSYFAFEPSARAFGQFMRAVGIRYSGHFQPRGESTLPRVGWWEIWNEPNFGEDLAPQAIDGSSVLYAPRMYRALADAAWSALRATGHGHDLVLIGSLAAAGAQAGPGRLDPQGLPGTYGETKPLSFLRELYCLDPGYHHYLGAAAAVRGCPTSRGGYRRFRAEHPILFAASGVSDHPYVLSGGLPPTRASSSDPSYAQFSQLGHFAASFDRIQRSYGSGRRFPVWNTEYGYITCPPNCHHGYVSPATASAYLNWAEYLSWRNPRIADTMQYLLFDPNPSVGTPEYGGFASGLVFYSTVFGGTRKATYDAYRLPLFLPRTRSRRGRGLEVWGDVRPAHFAIADGDGTQFVQIQFAPGSSHAWRAVDVVKVTDPHGYFDVRVAFPSSGSVRIAWTYPPMDTTFGTTLTNGYVEPLGAETSRVVKVTIT